MNDSNRIRLTWISFFSYALTGALVIVTGMVMGNIAEYFNLPVSSMSNTFTFLNAGILISIFLNAWLMEIIPLKRQLIFGFVLMVLAVAGLMLGKSLTMFSLCMFILGVVSGITMSIGTFLITHMYAGRQRGSRLLFTDSFFSMAGMIFPIVAAMLLARHIGWYWVYACIGLLYGDLRADPVLRIPGAGQERRRRQPAGRERKWGIGVLFLSIAALCYILGQLGFIQWVPEYATKSFNMDIGQAGKLVSDFWTSYMVGMWVFSFILRFFDLQRIVTVLAALATGAMYLFVSTDNPEHLATTSWPWLRFQRHLHHADHPRLAADQGLLAEAGQLYPDLRHHRHHADLRGYRPDRGERRRARGADHRQRPVFGGVRDVPAAGLRDQAPQPRPRDALISSHQRHQGARKAPFAP
ncbi:MFS transporter TsgA [Serratia ureilytica]